MRDIQSSKTFDRDVKRIARQGKDIAELCTVIAQLAVCGTLPTTYQDHALSGTRQGTRDCHIKGDWVLLYRIDEAVLYLERTGSHGELFDR